MKTKDEVLQDFLHAHYELTSATSNLPTSLLDLRATLLADILGEDLPEEYWEVYH